MHDVVRIKYATIHTFRGQAPGRHWETGASSPGLTAARGLPGFGAMALSLQENAYKGCQIEVLSKLFRMCMSLDVHHSQ